jgi:hypothetical protein
MTPGPKQPPSIDINSIVIGGGIGLLSIFVPILSIMGEIYDRNPPIQHIKTTTNSR